MICFLYRFISKGCEFVSNRVPRPGIWGSTSSLIGDELGTPVNGSAVSVEKGGVPRVDRGDEHSCARPSVDNSLSRRLGVRGVPQCGSTVARLW